ncbi:MAG: hypothetical protein JWO47_114 [Candidatus Saccharibacteria bacterium]|nr:hypothetical protein [Candidatus Saccharibacteria bacterium]
MDFDHFGLIGGNATLGGLTVKGDTVLQQLTVARIITSGNAPTAVLGASTTVTGKDSSFAIVGNDSAGTVSYTSGTTAAATLYTPAYTLAAGEQITVKFNKTYTTAPRIALTAKDANSATARYFVTNTTDGFVIHFLDAPSASTTYNFDYILIQ